MLIEPILGYKSVWRILELLFETPRKSLSRPELLKYTRLGNAPLSLGLQRLCLANIVIQEKKGKKERYYLNLANEYVIKLKECWELERKDTHYMDYDTKIIISEFLRQIDFQDIERILLFGSHARGTASVRSDIDLAIILKTQIKNELEIAKTVQSIKKKFSQEIQVHYFSNKEFATKNKLTEEIKSEGILLT